VSAPSIPNRLRQQKTVTQQDIHAATLILSDIRNLTPIPYLCTFSAQQVEAAEDDDTAADDDTHTAHSRDQGDQEGISAAADGDDSPSAAAGDHISAHHEISAEEAEAAYGLTAGSEGYAAERDSTEQQEAGSYAEEASVQQQNGEIEEEEEYAPAEHDEQAKADQVGLTVKL
jgi:hypothetical protein